MTSSKTRWLFLILSCGLLASATSSVAQVSESGKLTVGTKETPPFVMKAPDGSWHGISIDLWEIVAQELKLDYELREFDLQGLLSAVENNEVDAGVAALTITSQREQSMDFTHPFYTTGFGIAAAMTQQTSPTKIILARLTSQRFLRFLGILALVLFVVGALVWLAERKHNPEQFGNGVANGLWSGFWWAGVTLTTVGYGDKAPKTVIGRLLTLIWMFTGIIFIGTVIAGMTSALTVSQLESPIRSEEDLARARVATLAGSTSEAYLRDNRIVYLNFPTILDGLKAVANGQVDAMVYDAPLLRYISATEMEGKVQVLPNTFERQDYCFALPSGSSLREPINRVLLKDTTKALWRDILYTYLHQAPTPPPRLPEDEGEIEGEAAAEGEVS